MSDILALCVSQIIGSLIGLFAGFHIYDLVKARRSKPPNTADKEQTILVRRVKSSFRNPARTYEHDYSEYKTRDGLYAPVKPGKGSMADEIDVEGKR